MCFAYIQVEKAKTSLLESQPENYARNIIAGAFISGCCERGFWGIFHFGKGATNMDKESSLWYIFVPRASFPWQALRKLLCDVK